MIRVYRLAQGRFSSDAFDGTGGLHAPGRWHKKGSRIVYTSATLELAVLETLVHMDPSDMPEYVSIGADIPKAVFDARHVINAASLPRNWTAHPPLPALQHVGMRWLKSGSSLVCEVPSAVVPESRNYLLNPGHPHMAKVKIAKPAPFNMDPRLRK